MSGYRETGRRFVSVEDASEERDRVEVVGGRGVAGPGTKVSGDGAIES
jgi:hypothetical protein